jgi:TonB family protein
MGTFIAYILKSAICLIVFYLFYKLLLSKDTFHRFNRIVLLSLLLLSFTVPFGIIGLRSASQASQAFEQESFVMQAQSVEIVQAATTPTSAETKPVWILMLVLTYLAGIVFCFSRQLWSMTKMFRLMEISRPTELESGVTLYVHTKPIAPFSWMKRIVLSEKDLTENGHEILTHELAHIQNKHSWDLILADICIFFQWFNPAAWLLKQEIQSIHEFEADDRVLQQGIDAKQYQLLLIKKAVGTRLYSMANSFNHSSLKKRITMMLKEKSNPWARLKYVYVLPLACVTLLAFARPDVSNVEANTVEKVNDLLSLTQSENVSVPTADKNKENYGNANTLAVKNAEQPAVEALLAVNNPQEATQKATTVNTNLSVSGKVLNAMDKKPLTSVSVAEYDGSGRILSATVTKDDGTFELKAKNSANKLKFSCIGYKTALSPINSNLTVLMEEATLQVDEIVVVGYAATPSTANTSEKEVTREGVLLVEQMPSYPGGDKALMEYLRNNVRYPTNAADKGVEGRVVCSCVISAQGAVTEVKVLASVDPDLDKEAMRVILNMPNWIPGRQNGKNCPVKFAIPIAFKLNK